MTTSFLSTPLADLHLSKDRIITIIFTGDGEIDETHGSEILNATVQLANKKPHAVLYDFNQKSILLRNIARQFASVRNEHESHVFGRAFLCYSLQDKLEAQHFIQYNKPLVETRIFMKMDKAQQWLLKMLKGE